MVIDQIIKLNNFSAIKKAYSIEELNRDDLLNTYEIYKNGIPGQEIFGLRTRFAGNFYHMAASIIIYRLALNRKEKKIYYLFYCFIYKSFY